VERKKFETVGPSSAKGGNVQGTEVVKMIRTAVQEVKANNEEVVSADALLNYLDALEKNVESVTELDKQEREINIAVFRVEHERNLAHYNAQQVFANELFKSVITSGQAALKSAILVNGGGAVALLAFIGNIWSKNTGAAAVQALTCSIALFSFGVLGAAVATSFTYLTQLSYGHNWKKTAVTFHVASVLAVIVAYVLFGCGAYEAYIAFARHLKP
jgi:hypothetical protein